jgi:hypothetical protein
LSRSLYRDALIFIPLIAGNLGLMNFHLLSEVSFASPACDPRSDQQQSKTAQIPEIRQVTCLYTLVARQLGALLFVCADVRTQGDADLFGG